MTDHQNDDRHHTEESPTGSAPTDPATRVGWVYQAESRDELRRRYDAWADDYETDLTDDYGWLGPAVAVAAIAARVDPAARILDAGVGTGMVGSLLAERGFTDIVGIDMSKGMLAAARAKGIYADLRQAVLGEPIDLPTDRFDAALCVGTFTEGHAPASGLRELVRMTAPGGFVAFTLRADIYETHGFRQEQGALEASGAWRVAHHDDDLTLMPKGEPDVRHHLWIYQVE